MDLLEHGDVLIHRAPGQAAETADGRVHAVIARGRQPDGRTGRVVIRDHGDAASFGIGILTLIFRTVVWVFVVQVRYPPRGTLPSDAD